ncbi:hypothetical protein QYE76_004616 [Lolium multiflorum]|uniref:Protein kinase domain-containing protein n=1 Tax=Lolium multiflorum TaxID=4521 RepID=A0AAD8W2M9_LOLMU|nr:hypothetical protein QYE76_004616 [Lolium multiflorum]
MDGAQGVRQDTSTHITYVSDAPYVDGGETHKIAADQEFRADGHIALRTLRSFPSGGRNCYTLPTESGGKYLVRMEFMHGKYDGRSNPLSVRFGLLLGTNLWDTVTLTNTTDYLAYEAVFAAWASWVPVCLLNTGGGTPFVNTLELRQLGPLLYPDVTTDQPMSLYTRADLGAATFTRFPKDPYDRYWWEYARSSWANLSTQNTITHEDQDSFAVPSSFLRTAITTAGNGTVLNVATWYPSDSSLLFRVFLHFTDFQNSQLRQFNVYINDEELNNYSPKYLTASSVHNSGWSKTADGIYNITLAATNMSVLPPMISAYEIYNLIANDTPRTFSMDFPTYDHPTAAKPNDALVSTNSHGDHMQNSENRQFTYKELEKFTNKFERSIGQGGFGLVYYGRLEDDTEVAVKMRSETSSHGLDEFLAEVNSLTKVHHRNLVSLVGYCWEKDHLALVYEYMSRGCLSDLLRGKRSVGETLTWGTRVRIVLESAQGLDYLHKGCSLPIIHRDVKTNNILLGQNLRAKIADFGLCKTYLSEMQTHISTNAAGSAGYMDPEYYHTGWLTESSDVYSFGVVLLEVATGEPPILPGHGHIVQRVKQKIASGNVSMVADAKLEGAYDVNSMWKLVDTAMACTADAAIRRPTMAVVVAQLRESLALEESREDNSAPGSFMSTSEASMSKFGPSAR